MVSFFTKFGFFRDIGSVFIPNSTSCYDPVRCKLFIFDAKNKKPRGYRGAVVKSTASPARPSSSTNVVGSSSSVTKPINEVSQKHGKLLSAALRNKDSTNARTKKYNVFTSNPNGPNTARRKPKLGFPKYRPFAHSARFKRRFKELAAVHQKRAFKLFFRYRAALGYYRGLYFNNSSRSSIAFKFRLIRHFSACFSRKGVSVIPSLGKRQSGLSKTSGSVSFFSSRSYRRLRHSLFYGNKKPWYPNYFGQIRHDFSHFFSFFALRRTRAGLKLNKRAYLKFPHLRRTFFFSTAARRGLLRFSLSAQKHRLIFRFPFPANVYSNKNFRKAFRRKARFFRPIFSKTFHKLNKNKPFKTFSRYFEINRYKLHRAYLSRQRRQDIWHDFVTNPPLGMSSRVTRLYKRRYGSIAKFFTRAERFKKRRRYFRLRLRKRRLVPLMRTKFRSRRLYPKLPTIFRSRRLVYLHITKTTNNIFYSVFSRKQRLLATFSNGRTEFAGSKRMSTVACESSAKVLTSYLLANKTRAIFFVFTSRFNHFMRAAVKIFRSKKIKIAGFKYRMLHSHSLGLRQRSSRRV